MRQRFVYATVKHLSCDHIFRLSGYSNQLGKSCLELEHCASVRYYNSILNIQNQLFQTQT